MVLMVMALSLWKAQTLWIPVTALSPRLGFCLQACNFYYWKISYQKILFCSYSEAQERSRNEVDIKARASKIFSAMQSKGFSGYSEKDTASLYQFLLNLGIKSTTIEAQFLETPDILKFPVNRWNKTCEIMEQNGLSSSKILQNVALCPEILKIKPSTLSDNLLQYRQIKFGRHSLLSLLNRYPILFLSQPSQIKKRVTFLRSSFPPNVFTPLIRNNPNVLVDKWGDIMEKIMYIHKVMGLEQPQIASSEALGRSLLHIKTRHQFLFRAGLYITPNLEKDKQSDRRNPSLSNIMDTADTYFSNRVARLTEYEYKIFSSMMEEEESAYSDSEESDDDENPDFGYHDLS